MTQTEHVTLRARRKVVEIFTAPPASGTSGKRAGALSATGGAAKLFHKTKFGSIYLGDSLAFLRDQIAPKSVDLIMTSPPFGLVRKKDYGNVDSHEYLEWFKPFAYRTAV